MSVFNDVYFNHTPNLISSVSKSSSSFGSYVRLWSVRVPLKLNASFLTFSSCPADSNPFSSCSTAVTFPLFLAKHSINLAASHLIGCCESERCKVVRSRSTRIYFSPELIPTTSELMTAPESMFQV